MLKVNEVRMKQLVNMQTKKRLKIKTLRQLRSRPTGYSVLYSLGEGKDHA